MLGDGLALFLEQIADFCQQFVGSRLGFFVFVCALRADAQAALAGLFSLVDRGNDGALEGRGDDEDSNHGGDDSPEVQERRIVIWV